MIVHVDTRASMMEFICNICGSPNRVAREALEREKASCSSCGSSVRTRGLLHALSLELFGVSLPLPDFPRVKSLRGIGLSDSEHYAERLTAKFDYRNTFYTREPCFDIANPPPEEFGKYDFLLSSEVFEHVAPPVEKAFESAFRLLKPHGVLLLTVPYSIDTDGAERFDGIGSFGLAQVGDRAILVARSPAGSVQVFENLVFHLGTSGPALEMREFSEERLKGALLAAGFSQIRIHSEDAMQFGVPRAESWSLPVAARKAPFQFTFENTRDVLSQWAALRKTFREFGGELWVRLGFKLGLINRRRYFTPRGTSFEPRVIENENSLHEKQTKQ